MDEYIRLPQCFRNVLNHARETGVSDQALAAWTYRRFGEAALNGRLPEVRMIRGLWYGREGAEPAMAAALGLVPGQANASQLITEAA